MINIRFSTILIFAVLAGEPILAQTLPSCLSMASDADGDGYGWENNASCLVANTSLGAATFTNLETGNSVGLIRARWEPSDLLDDMVCQLFRFDGTYYQAADGGTLYEHYPLSQNAPFAGNVVFVSGSSVVTQTWSLDNGIYYGPSPLALSPWVQIVDYSHVTGSPPVNTPNAVRVWQTDTLFSHCHTTDPDAVIIPTGSVSQENAVSTTSNDNCDYSNAVIHNGWGWNPVTAESCAPGETAQTQGLDNCDYSNADIHDGWGWNAVTGQSCAPL